MTPGQSVDLTLFTKMLIVVLGKLGVRLEKTVQQSLLDPKSVPVKLKMNRFLQIIFFPAPEFPLPQIHPHIRCPRAPENE